MGEITNDNVFLKSVVPAFGAANSRHENATWKGLCRAQGRVQCRWRKISCMLDIKPDHLLSLKMISAPNHFPHSTHHPIINHFLFLRGEKNRIKSEGETESPWILRCMPSPRACDIYMTAAKLYPRFARVRFITIMNGDLRMQNCRQLLLRIFSIPPKKPFCQSWGRHTREGMRATEFCQLPAAVKASHCASPIEIARRPAERA